MGSVFPLWGRHNRNLKFLKAPKTSHFPSQFHILDLAWVMENSSRELWWDSSQMKCVSLRYDGYTDLFKCVSVFFFPHSRKLEIIQNPIPSCQGTKRWRIHISKSTFWSWLPCWMFEMCSWKPPLMIIKMETCSSFLTAVGCSWPQAFEMVQFSNVKIHKRNLLDFYF